MKKRAELQERLKNIDADLRSLEEKRATALYMK